jgi:hypothetical protein
MIPSGRSRIGRSPPTRQAESRNTDPTHCPNDRGAALSDLDHCESDAARWGIKADCSPRFAEIQRPLSDAELAVRHSERGGDCRVIHAIHADQLLARACPADYRDLRWSDPELLRDKATQSLVRATVVRRCRNSSDDPAVVRWE